MQPNTVSPTFMSLATMRSWYCCCTKHFAIETKQCVPCIVDLYMSTYICLYIFLSAKRRFLYFLSFISRHTTYTNPWRMLYFSCGESSITLVQKFYINLPMACRPLPNYRKYTVASSTEECSLRCHKWPVGDARRSSLADIFLHLLARLLHQKIICHYHCNGGSCRY